MNEHELSYFHLEQEEFNLKLKKGPDAESIAAMMSAMPQVAAAAPQAYAAAPAAAPQAGAPAEAAAPASDGTAITSPMVGTFYIKPSPDADDFVSVGTTISEGQTICIIEAMKVMNEIKAEKSGTITSIAIDDGTPVQYGDTLFTIK